MLAGRSFDRPLAGPGPGMPGYEKIGKHLVTLMILAFASGADRPGMPGRSGIITANQISRSEHDFWIGYIAGRTINAKPALDELALG